jgi:carboxypeptidase T
MQKYILLFLFCFVTHSAIKAQGAAAPTEPQELYSRVRVFLAGHEWKDIVALGLECDHGHLQPHEYWVSDLSARDLQLLFDNGFQYEVLINDVRQYYIEQNQSQNPPVGLQGSIRTPEDDCDGRIGHYTTPQNFRLGSMGGYLTYTQLLEELDSMCSKYPDLISCRAVIDPNTLTNGGRPIYWVRISDNPNVNENEPKALYTSLHHAREPLSLMQNIYYMWYLLENYATDDEVRYLVDNSELFFIPCVNPDGYVYNNTNSPNGGGMWRKNRRPNGGTSFGVDLNRNYGYAFAFNNSGSSGTTTSDTYRGPSAFSEPESRNIKFFCENNDIKLSLNYHSYGNMVVYPWAYNSAPTPDSTFFRQYARFMTYENRYITGSNMETVGYNTNGDADDWLYGEQTTKNKILAMTPEAGGDQYGFYPPSAQIENLCRGLIWQNLALPRTMLNYAVVSIQPNNFVATTLNSFIHYDITRYGFDNQGFTVSLNGLSDNIANTGAPRNYTSLSQYQTARDSIAFTLKTTVAVGDEIGLILTLDNGSVQWHDTLRYTLGSPLIAFADTSNDMTNWTNISGSATWATTTTTFYSAPNCITDSPVGQYANNANSELLLNQSLDLRGLRDAYLSFWAKWDIEDDYDYVQVLGSDGGAFVPLCGFYTNPGSADQIENEPLYDGLQSFWVKEQISLNQFLGASNVTIKLRLVSDGGVRADGFYFDDFQLNTIATPTNPIATTRLLAENNPYQLAQNQPNPARNLAYIPLQNFEYQPNTQFIVYNTLGQLVYTQDIVSQTDGITLRLDQWTSGIYYYQLRNDKWQSNTQKMRVE